MKSEREKYKESFENLLKVAFPEAKISYLEDGLWKLSLNEDRAFLYDYDFGANSSSADRVCIDRYLLWLLLEKKRVDEYNQLLEMEVIDRCKEREWDFEEVKNKLNKRVGERSIIIKPVIKSVAEAPEEYIYKVGSEEQAVEALNKTGLDGSLVITDFVEELNEEYRLFLIKHAGKIEFLLCLKKQRTDSTLTEEFVWQPNHEISVISENKISSKIKEIATNIFRMLDLNFGYIEIARNDKGYLVMETNSRPLVKLFEYCTKIESEKYAKLVELIKETINRRIENIKKRTSISILWLGEGYQKPEKKFLSYLDKEDLRRKWITEACSKLDLNVDFYTEKLNQNPLTVINDKKGNSILMPNYYFGNIDNSVVANICVDKDITAKVLRASSVPCVEHELFNKGEEPDSVVENIINKAKKWNMNVVVKQRAGSSGVGVYQIKNVEKNRDKLQTMVKKILQEKNSKGLAVCPYLEIEEEYRVLIFYGRALLIHKKNRPFVIGDGQQRLDKLIETKIDGSRQQIPAEIIADLAERKIDLNQVLPKNEKIHLIWRHNLHQGAELEMIKKEDYEKKPAVKKNVDELVDLAKKAANAIGINYAAADIIKVENEVGYKVLEVNNATWIYSFGEVVFGRVLQEILTSELEIEQYKVLQVQADKY